MTSDNSAHERVHHDDTAVDEVLMNLQLMRDDLETAQALDRMKTLHLARIDSRLRLLSTVAERMKTGITEDEKRIQRLRAIAAEKGRL